MFKYLIINRQTEWLWMFLSFKQVFVSAFELDVNILTSQHRSSISDWNWISIIAWPRFRNGMSLSFFRDVDLSALRHEAEFYGITPLSMFIICGLFGFMYMCATLGVHQGCPLSPVLLNIFLENIVLEARHHHHTSIYIEERPMCNLRWPVSRQ